jgi:hypothetical protein
MTGEHGAMQRRSPVCVLVAESRVFTIGVFKANRNGVREHFSRSRLKMTPSKPAVHSSFYEGGGLAEKMRVLADSNGPKVALQGKSTRSHRYPMKSRLSVSFLQKLYFFEFDSCHCEVLANRAFNRDVEKSRNARSLSGNNACPIWMR